MRLTLIATAALCASSLAARADTFNFNYTGNAISASGTFTTAPESNGTYTITGITGTRNGATITQLFAPSGYQSNDNLLFSSGSLIDFSGVSYAAGGVDYNLYAFTTTPAVYHECNSGSVSNCSESASLDPSVAFTVTAATPEPSSFALLATGLLGVAGVVRKRFA